MTMTLGPAVLEVTPVDHGVTVRWFDVEVGADFALREHVAQVAGVDPQDVEVGRSCADCGSSDHGRPWASHGVHVSLARSGPHLVTAVSTSGRVGVDVESVGRVDDVWDDRSSELQPDRVVDGSGRAALWCRYEAIRKREGTPFEDPDALRRAHGFVDDLVAPSGYCAAVAYADPLTR